mgnify:CR=1 FL=1
MASKKEKAVKGAGRVIGALTGDAAERARKRKLIAKRKAIAKNVAANKKRDAAGMARATKLAREGQAAAAKKKRKTPKKMRHPADPNMPSTAALDRGEVKGFGPAFKPLPKRERWVPRSDPRHHLYEADQKAKPKPKPKPKAAAAPKKKPKPKTAIVQTPKGFVRKKLQKHPKAAAAGGGKKPPNGNGKKVGAAGGRKRSPEEVRMRQNLAKKNEALAEKAYRELKRLDAMYDKWGMPKAEWQAKRTAVIKKMGKDMDQYKAQAKRLGSTPKGKKPPNPWAKPKPKKK